MLDARSSYDQLQWVPQVATMESEADLPGLESMLVMGEIQSLSMDEGRLQQQLWSMHMGV